MMSCRLCTFKIAVFLTLSDQLGERDGGTLNGPLAQSPHIAAVKGGLGNSKSCATWIACRSSLRRRKAPARHNAEGAVICSAIFLRLD